MRAAVVLGMVVASVAIADAAPEPHDPGAYVFVIDRSSSMKGDKLELVKSATLQAIKRLDPRDQVAVVAFAGDASIVSGLGNANRRGLASQIARVHAGRGDNLATGLTKAFVLLASVTAGTRHIIVVTDSAALDQVEPAFAKAREGITVSAIGVQSENPKLASMLAWGGGQSFAVDYLEMLPRRLVEAAEAPRPHKDLAVVFLVDRSGSMEGARLEAAVTLVRTSVEAMEPSDVASVIAFDVTADVIVQPTRVANRMRIAVELAKVKTGTGASFRPALEEAQAMFAGVKGATKIVVLITDSDAASEGVTELVTAMANQRISVWVVGFPGVDRKALTNIADLGDGRFYAAEDSASLPTLFTASKP